MALIPPVYLNSVISIGVEGKNEKNEPEFTTLATGFLIGKPTGEVNEAGDQLYRVFVVTNRHVFYDTATDEYWKEVIFRFNTNDNKSHLVRIGLLNADNKPLWSMHENKNVDLAVLPISPKKLIETNIDHYFFRQTDLFFAKDFNSKNITTGDGLFVLGFPMGISGKAKNFVIVRQGIIARVDEEVLAEGFFYIDASAYPGNSGGPVIIKPEMVSIKGTGVNDSAGLIGVISSGHLYRDVAISQEADELKKMVYSQQTGLIKIVPVEHIYEIIDTIMKSEATVQEARIEDVIPDITE